MWLRDSGHVHKDVTLAIVRDVEGGEGRFRSLSNLPWLRIVFPDQIPADRWVRLIFRCNLYEPLCRPILRFIGAEAGEDILLPGAIFGRAIWLGKIPKGTREIWISPTNRVGRFGFSIESMEIVPRIRLLALCFKRDPRRAAVALAARLAGLPFVADLQFRRTLSPTSLKHYDSWRQSRLPKTDYSSENSPGFDWEAGPVVALVISAASQSLATLIPSLKHQPYKNWRLFLIDKASPAHVAVTRMVDPRVVAVDDRHGMKAILDLLPANAWIGALPDGSQIAEYLPGVLAEAAMRDAEVNLFYGDEDYLAATGRRTWVELKPDWSPRFYSARDYLGDALFFRVEPLKPIAEHETINAFVRSSKLHARNLIAGGHKVDHIRRILLTLPETRRSKPIVTPSRSEKLLSSAGASASIILPTRDRLDLLAPCITSLKGQISDNMEIIVIDNGSVEKATISFLSALVADRRFRVIRRPGPFNFSSLCNEAAQVASAPVLIFLNNDCELTPQTRLQPLLSYAQEPNIGAVGAKLLYQDGRLQHAGVTLGIDGYAGHLERGIGGEETGYFGRLRAGYEVSAVSAACFAIEKRKFEAVGGFDATNLPVDLNDIDLCLRLAERGWKSICACECILIHRESKSRGKTLRPDKLYRTEHHYMHARWIDKLRDDPYFHPALSLDCLDVRLG